LQAFSQVEPEPDLTPLQRQERLLIIEALRQTGDNVVDAARLLKMGQATVYRKIRQYHIAHTRRRRKRV
jgi:transcriptional regulator of acetoin/glycerol metabolism